MLKNVSLLVETMTWVLVFVTDPESDVISDSSSYFMVLQLGLVALVCNCEKFIYFCYDLF